MKSFNTIIFFLFVFNLPVHGQWQQVYIDTSIIGSDYNLYSLSFASDKIVFLGACSSPTSGNDITVLKTTDGGNTWIRPLSFPISKSGCWFPLFMVNKDIGYTTGLSNIVKTTNGGETWYNPDSNKSISNSQALYFLNEKVGFSGGNDGFSIYKTTDGGVNWNPYSIWPVNSVFQDFLFINDSVGFAVGWYGSMLAKTTDIGKTWKIVTQNYPLYSIDFPSDSIGYAVGWQGTVIKTSDEGNTWGLLETGTFSKISLRSISCLNNNTCFVVGEQGTILKTFNGGVTWSKDSSGTTKNLNSIACTKSGTCLIAGDSGILLKKENSTNGILTHPENKKKDKLYIYPNPSIHQTTIQYTPFHQNVANSHIIISDINGRVLKTIETCELDASYSTVINNDSFSSGIFQCILIENDQIIEVKKLIITK